MQESSRETAFQDQEDSGVSTFIEQFGNIIYKPGLMKVSGPCEIPGCEETRTKRQTKEFMTAVESGYLTAARFEQSAYVIDHCHEHGYVRGVLCGTCNNLMRIFDYNGYYRPSDWIIGTGLVRYEDIGLVIRALGLRGYATNCLLCGHLPSVSQANPQTSPRPTPRP